MRYAVEVNSLLVLPKDFKIEDLGTDKSFSVTKQGSRLFPIEIPLEFCDSDYRYLGKAKITKATVQKESTELEFTVLKIFSDDESRVYTSNFIKP